MFQNVKWNELIFSEFADRKETTIFLILIRYMRILGAQINTKIANKFLKVN